MVVTHHGGHDPRYGNSRIMLGVAVIVTLPEIFVDFQPYRLFAFGPMLTLLMIFRLCRLLTFEAKPLREKAEPESDLTPEPAPGPPFAGNRSCQLV
jgi:hypothetical protein